MSVFRPKNVLLAEVTPIYRGIDLTFPTSYPNDHEDTIQNHFDPCDCSPAFALARFCRAWYISIQQARIQGTDPLPAPGMALVGISAPGAGGALEEPQQTYENVGQGAAN